MNEKMMKIAMIGSGYVGLVSGVCLADFGHRVVCVDKDAAKIDALRAGRMPIYEPGLDMLVAGNVAAGRLSFTTDIQQAVAGADAVFIAVGTPSRRGGGHADLSYVFAAAEEIGRAVTGPVVVVTKSTVPVGTGDEVEAILRRSCADHPIAVVSNPEFLREGAAIDDFKQPDRIVVGTDDPRAQTVMTEVYRPLFVNQSPILFTGRRTAELIKYGANAFLATKITFINELADLAEKVGADIMQVARGIGLDDRIGSRFLNAGPGYGGSCFPKDTLALLQTADEAEVSLRVVAATIEANDLRKRAMADKIRDAVGGDLSCKRIGLLGLTFKPGTDDMRDAPSLAIVPALIEGGATVRAFDPEGMEQAGAMLPGVEMCATAADVARDADVLVLLTEWDLFRALDLAALAATMATPTLVDLRNVYDPVTVARAGMTYRGIGRGDLTRS